MKKHFSKWMALMLALTMLCLCLGACGEPDTPATDPAASTNKPADKPSGIHTATVRKPSSGTWCCPFGKKLTRTSMWRPSGRTAASTIR